MTPATATAAHTIASSRAARNWAANLRALAGAQPGLVDRLQSLVVAGEWVLARDGALTLIDPVGHWLGECSVPYRAAVAMMKSLDPRGTVACYLAPNHAAQVRAAFEVLSAQQAIVVLQPDLQILRTLLSCEDFSSQLAANRLFVAAGEDWATELRAIFDQHPGLPTPQQFIKLPMLSAEIVDPLIAESQPVFAAVVAARNDTVRQLQSTRRARSVGGKRLGLVIGSRFELWNDAACALAEAMQPTAGANLVPLDADQPVHTAPLAVAQLCGDVHALLTADSNRSAFPDVVPMELPWITWVTRGHIPQAVACGPNDALVLADASWREAAIAQGWTEKRLAIGGFPPLSARLQTAGSTCAGWTILADTLPITKPDLLDKFSSCLVLWELIEDLLHRDPFALGSDVTGFLRQYAQRVGVAESTLDAKPFIDNLLLPSYVQGIARAMMRAKLPLRVFGAGWQKLAEFEPVSAGPIESRAALRSAVASSPRLLHVWPAEGPHPVFAAGLPVLRRNHCTLSQFVQRAKQQQCETFTAPAISTDLVLSLFA